MLQSRLGIMAFCGLLTVLAGTKLHAVDAVQATINRFEIKTISSVEQTIGGKKQKIEAQTELCYRWRRQGRERTLSLESMHVTASMDGKEVQNAFFSRNKLINSLNGKKIEVPVETAPSKLKDLLQASFDTPLCGLVMDETGKEIKRNIVAGPNAELVLKNGTISNACLFHPPFHPSKKEWSTEANMTLGNDGYVRGKLSYKKAPDENAKQVVTLSGVLANDGFLQPGTNILLKNVRYVVKGKQTFDTAQQEWTDGEQIVDVTYQIHAADMPIGSAVGKISLAFKHLPAKKP